MKILKMKIIEENGNKKEKELHDFFFNLNDTHAQMNGKTTKTATTRVGRTLEKFMYDKPRKHIVVRRHHHRRNRVMSQAIARSSLSVLKVSYLIVRFCIF